MWLINKLFLSGRVSPITKLCRSDLHLLGQRLSHLRNYSSNILLNWDKTEENIYCTCFQFCYEIDWCDLLWTGIAQGNKENIINIFRSKCITKFLTAYPLPFLCCDVPHDDLASSTDGRLTSASDFIIHMHVRQVTGGEEQNTMPSSDFKVTRDNSW